MKKNSLTRFSFSILLSLAVLSCSIPNDLTDKKVQHISINTNRNTISGKVEFPKNTDSNYKIKATIGQVGDRATVSLIYPPDDNTNPNVTIATGLSDSSGAFTITTSNFEPVINKVYILEAIKRIGSSGNDLISVRTYLRNNGTNWESVTTPSLTINKQTTAITIIDKNDNSISSSDTIGTIVSGNPSTIGTVTVSTINNVVGMVNSLLIDNLDPVRFIDYQNNKYFILREISANKNYLIANKSCPNCDLSGEDLSNKDLSSSDLSNANLRNVDLTNTNLSNTNLTNVNLINTKLNNTILTGATWIDGMTICQNDSIGLCMFPDSIVNTYTTNNQINPSTSNLAVTWESLNQDGSGSGIYAQRYTTNGTLQGSEFKVNDYTVDNQSKPSIVMNNSTGDFVIIWESLNQDGSGSGIYRRIINSDGIPQGSDFRVNQYTTNNQSNPLIAMDNIGKYFITWESLNQDGSGSGIYARRFSSVGVPINSEFEINTYTTDNQKTPSIAMNSVGNFVITWVSTGQDGALDGIYARTFFDNGTPMGLEFRVNSYTINSQINPSIAMDSMGNFIVTWQSNLQDGSGYGVYAQRYNSNGTAQGDEFRVNSYTTNNQINPSLSMNRVGNFVITWVSTGQDGSLDGIYAQRYNSSGNPQGAEFRVNSYTTNNQLNPSVVMNNVGDFVVTWQSNLQDGSGYGVYLKKYNSNGEQTK